MSEEGQVAPRKRKVTHIALDWLAQRLRRCEEIKAEIESGGYSVETEKVARSIANEDK